MGVILEAVCYSHLIVAAEIFLRDGAETGCKEGNGFSSLGAAILEGDRADPSERGVAVEGCTPASYTFIV